MHLIRTVTLICIMMPIFAFAQSDNPDHRLLGQYSVVRHALENGPDVSWSDSIAIHSSLADLSTLACGGHLQYRATVLWSFRGYELLEIVDQTHFRLHGLFTDLYLIDRDNPWYRYRSVTRDDVERLITDVFLQGQNLPSDTVCSSLVELYNAVVFSDSITDYGITRLMSSRAPTRPSVNFTRPTWGARSCFASAPTVAA